jgi:anionic cell wall polymer biosynthesis LytR-Cps2A-Psr (LCP) family protein
VVVYSSVGPALPHTQEPTNETRNTSARNEALEARKEAAKEARLKAARQAAAKQAEQASGELFDVLVLGVDRRPNSAEGESTRSDTLMLVRVTPATGEVKLLSVPRDLYVEVESGERDRINTAYAYGGVE